MQRLSIISVNAGREPAKKQAFFMSATLVLTKILGIRVPPCIGLMAVQHLLMNVIDDGTGTDAFFYCHVTKSSVFPRRYVWLRRNVRPRNGQPRYDEHQLPAFLHPAGHASPPCIRHRHPPHGVVRLSAANVFRPSTRPHQGHGNDFLRHALPVRWHPHSPFGLQPGEPSPPAAGGFGAGLKLLCPFFFRAGSLPLPA